MTFRMPEFARYIGVFGIATVMTGLAICWLAMPVSAREHPELGTGPYSLGSKTPTMPAAQPVRKAKVGQPRSPNPPQELKAGILLIAHPRLRDPNFLETVVLLVEYSARGAMGLVINRPTPIVLADALEDMDELRHRSDLLYEGGPVERHRMFLLIDSQEPVAEALPVIPNLHMSTSAEVLRGLANDRKNQRPFRAYAGYAGWGPGQLDGEFDRGDWHLWWADHDTVFSDKGTAIWRELIGTSTQRWVQRPLGIPRGDRSRFMTSARCGYLLRGERCGNGQFLPLRDY